jgi:two-component system sensor histidine kinase/response regulator
MPQILIVDDEMYQRILIRETLSADPSFTFVEAEDGAEALELVGQSVPDLVLLDVMMPKLDGFQVCKALKTNPAYQSIPVIMITALGQVQDKVTGLDSGADDFVNKPFEESELQARVRSALRVKAMHDQLQKMLHIRDDLVRMIMHDMGNLVAVISSALALHQRMPPESAQALQFVRDAYDANLSLGDMINDALDVSSLETQKMPLRRENTDLAVLSQAVIEAFRGAAIENDVRMDLYIEEGLSTIACVDMGIMRRVISNLLTNALKHAPGSSYVAIHIIQGSQPNWLRIAVSDEGPGISPEELATIFNKYEQAKQYAARRDRPGRGLGLTFSKLAIEAHSGMIGVESTLGSGATFIIDIPRS